jgi:hypothetical protein
MGVQECRAARRERRAISILIDAMRYSLPLTSLSLL